MLHPQKTTSRQTRSLLKNPSETVGDQCSNTWEYVVNLRKFPEEKPVHKSSKTSS